MTERKVFCGSCATSAHSAHWSADDGAHQYCALTVVDGDRGEVDCGCQVLAGDWSCSLCGLARAAGHAAECPIGISKDRDRLRQELTALGHAAVDGLLIGHVFYPRQTTEPLPLQDTPLNREELKKLRAGCELLVDPFMREVVSRLLATVEQRDRIYAAIHTDADPAGTAREVIELRDLVGQLTRLIEEKSASEGAEHEESTDGSGGEA